jgi:hypothetical protein
MYHPRNQLKGPLGPSTIMWDGNTAIFDPFLYRVFAVFNVPITFCGQIVAPLHSRFAIVIYWWWQVSICNGITERWLVRNHFWKFIVRQHPALVARILASHELSDVCSCCYVFQVSGPPDLNMIAQLILLNLNRGSWIPAQTALPSWEPKHALLYVLP